MSGGSGFDGLDAVIQHHIVNSLGWDSLRPLQDQAVLPIFAGEDALLLAPTAGGKTEAAIFPLLTRMTQEDWTGTSVLYVCPLRALLNNLQPRLAEYAGWLGRRAEVRHGDTTAGVRKRLVSDPPDVLLTTPESLEAMLVSTLTNPRALFDDLRAVVVDEIHAFAGDDRGWHLLGVLSRLEMIAGRPLQRIGLSATLGNPVELLGWLQGGGGRAGVVVDPGGEVQQSEIGLDWVGGVPNAAKVIAGLHRGEKRLVFADSRRVVEQLALELRQREVHTFVSHSSLSADERHRSEQAFAEARDCVITATSTLELGIDVGDLDRCLQVGSPRTVASMLQRLGRTGRRAGSSRNMLFLETTDDEFLRSCGLLLLWSEGYVEPIEPPKLPFHVAAQQLLGLVLQERAVDRNEWMTWFSRFPACTAAEWRALFHHMVSEGYLGEDGAVVFAGPMAERRYGGLHYRDIMAVFTADPQMTVLQGRNEIGTLDPLTLRAKVDGPRYVTLGGRGWKVTHIDWNRHRAFVEPSDRGGRVLWHGLPQPLSKQLCQAIRRVLVGEDLRRVTLTRRAEARLAELREKYADRVSAGVPDVMTEDESGRPVWWTFLGGRENASILAGLGRVAPELLGQSSTWNNFAVTFGEHVLVGEARRALRKVESAALSDPESLRPNVDEGSLQAVKFGDMVPKGMLESEVSAR